MGTQKEQRFELLFNTLEGYFPAGTLELFLEFLINESNSGGITKHSELDLDDGLNPHGLTKLTIGLGNVNDTSDINKPLSNDMISALSTKEGLFIAGTTNDYYRGDKTWQVLSKTSVGLGNVPNVDARNRNIHTGTQSAATISDFNAAVLVTLLQDYIKGKNSITNLDSILLAVQKLNNVTNLPLDYHFLKDDLIGSLLDTTNSASNAGSVTSIGNVGNIINIKGTIGHSTFGLVRITMQTNNNSKASWFTQNTGYATLSNVGSSCIAYECEYYFSTNSLVNFATDPTLIAVGFMTNWTINNPLQGIYVRPPRTGETAFLKYCVRVAGAETVFSTTISYTISDENKMIKTRFVYDSSTNIFSIIFNTDVDTNLKYNITNFTTTYPSAGTAYIFGAGIIRNGNAVTPLGREMYIDSISQLIRPNLYNDSLILSLA